MAIERGSDVTRLPRGATGFRDRGTEPLPLTDTRGFASVCYEAARLVGARVLEIAPPGVTPSFHTAVMKCGELTVGVLGHMHLPFIAIAEVPTGGVVFIDGCDDLEEALRASGAFRLLTRDELETPIGLIDTSDLDTAERNEIGFWKPANLGELLFNYWD
ncbi:hypothetical protein Psi02_49370 [Planotetraspora silvatica]|uniref:Uncharacterized protein n=1 Tax=Planotetraspora silvatica TaxID=234614 RepID=A0A8J3XTK8_9ACTN|nr:hypothetical protein [Planotetraspora silvatica]GII48513.1 hypothetical protein Psi02_49370 [Planotetraspora silvatica]